MVVRNFFFQGELPPKAGSSLLHVSKDSLAGVCSKIIYTIKAAQHLYQELR